MGAWMIYYCRFCEQLRDILYDAPWSSFDLICGSIVFWLGGYFLVSPGLFAHYGVYQVLARFGDEWVWGLMCVVFGAFDLVVLLWSRKLAFGTRLLARMGIAFCLTSLAFNNLGNTPPPASAITYSVLALAANWSVLRTRSDGR
jgi:hypothetical protein